MNMRLIIVVIFLTGLTFSGCKKYEEGPRISLKSKKERVVNKWQYEEYLQYVMCGPPPCSTGYVDLTSVYQEYYIEFNEDNTFMDFQKTAGYNPKVYEGEWKFIDDKMTIDMCYNGNCNTYTWRIIRLKEQEFWIEEILNGFVWSKRKLKPL